MQKKYELMLLVGALTSSESAARDIMKGIKSHIESEGGNTYFDEFWGLKRIAYKIEKNTEGYYQVFNINFDTTKIKDLERYLVLNKDIIRYLITKIEQDDYKPYSLEELKIDEKERYETVIAKRENRKTRADFKKNPPVEASSNAVVENTTEKISGKKD